MEFLADAFGNGHPFAEVLRHERCTGVDHMRDELARVEALGGEGLMLRQPSSDYHTGRSMTLLKVKTFHDAEAVVIGHQPGKGRHKGRLGALLVQLDDGTEFSVGTGFSDKQREAPPIIGSTITFRYQELTDGGVPRFPSFIRGADTASSSAASAPSSAAAAARKPAAKAPVVRAEAKPAPKAQASSTTGASEDGETRYFEFVDGKSDKFWEIKRDGVAVRVRYGRNGADGTTKTKEFDDESDAVAHIEKLIAEKTKKGYEEVE